MIELVVHHNSDGPNSNESSFYSSQDEDERKINKDIDVRNRQNDTFWKRQSIMKM